MAASTDAILPIRGQQDHPTGQPTEQSPAKPPQQTVQPISPGPPVTALQFAAVSLAAATTGLNDISLLPFSNPQQASANSPLSLLCTSTAFSLGAILAAACVAEQQHRQLPALQLPLPLPLPRAAASRNRRGGGGTHSHPTRLAVPVVLSFSRGIPRLLLAGSALAALARALPLALRWVTSSSSAGTAAPSLVAAASALLLGAGGSSNLAAASLLCARRRGGAGGIAGALGLVYASVGAGVVMGLLMLFLLVGEGGSAGGIGAWAGPGGRGWGYDGYDLAMLALAVLSAVALAVAFGARDEEEREREEQQRGGREWVRSVPAKEDAEISLHPGVLPTIMSRTERNTNNGFPPPASRTTVLGALFAFAYQAAVVTIPYQLASSVPSWRSGWPSLGYTLVMAGFWAGITVGRMVSSPLAQNIGERRFVSAALVLVPAVQMVFWLAPEGVRSAVVVAAGSGLLLGPVYPCALAGLIRRMGEHEEVNDIGIIMAFGSTAGAIALVTISLIAEMAGPFVLQTIATGLCGLMLLCWYSLPRGRDGEWRYSRSH